MFQKNKKMVLFLLVAMSLAWNAGIAAGKATPQECFQKVLDAAYLLQNLGEEGLQAFNDPHGEFVWKDSYVYVMNCQTGVLAATPDHPEFIGQNIMGMQDPNGVFLIKDLCEVGQQKAGGWVEYMWQEDKAMAPARKICFAISVPNTSWTVLAGIYDDTVTLEELNRLNK